MNRIPLVTTDEYLQSTIHAILYGLYHADGNSLPDEKRDHLYAILEHQKRYTISDLSEKVVDAIKFESFVYEHFLMDIDINIAFKSTFQAAARRGYKTHEHPIMVRPIQLIPFVLRLYEDFLAEHHYDEYGDRANNTFALKCLFNLIKD